MRNLPLAVAMLLSGCATYGDHLRAGRLGDACRAAQEDPANRAHFEQWLQQRVQARATLVPAATVEGLMGGPLAEYGTLLGVYEVAASSPGGELNLFGLDGTTQAPRLLAMLPPLVVASEPLMPPGPVDPGDFLPGPVPSEASPSSGGGSGLLGGVLGALAGAAYDIGRVMGGLMLFPAAMSLGIVMGGMEVIRDPSLLLRPGTEPLTSSWTTSPPPGPEIPIHVVKPNRVNGSLDALLEEADYQLLLAQRVAEWEQQKSAVAAEHQRRTHLAETLTATLGVCRGAGCRWVLSPGNVQATLDVSFPGSDGPCVTYVPVTVNVPVADGPSRPPWPPPSINQPVRFLDVTAPGWAHKTPTTSSLAWNPAANALRAEDLLCTVRVGRAPRSKVPPPSLSVRVSLGRNTTRVQRWLLGAVGDGATFVLPQAHLEPGERLRMSFADVDLRRHLGGGLTEMVGQLPLVVRAGAVEARCTVAQAHGLAAAVRDAQEHTGSLLEQLAGALKAGDAAEVTRLRLLTRHALNTLAMHAGWESEPVVAALQAFSAVDPAEKGASTP
jgi:hypothetical protein